MINIRHQVPWVTSISHYHACPQLAPLEAMSRAGALFPQQRPTPSWQASDPTEIVLPRDQQL